MQESHLQFLSHSVHVHHHNLITLYAVPPLFPPSFSYLFLLVFSPAPSFWRIPLFFHLPSLIKTCNISSSSFFYPPSSCFKGFFPCAVLLHYSGWYICCLVNAFISGFFSQEGWAGVKRRASQDLHLNLQSFTGSQSDWWKPFEHWWKTDSFYSEHDGSVFIWWSDCDQIQTEKENHSFIRDLKYAPKL